MSAMELGDSAHLDPIDIGANRRLHERFRFFTPIELSWREANNTPRFVAGTSMDVSLYGMLVETPERVTEQTKVDVTVCGIKISSKAKVAHCRSVQGFFRIGLDFETILLAEHIEALDSVLIKSLRSGR
jgi:hypothetical protein